MILKLKDLSEGDIFRLVRTGELFKKGAKHTAYTTYIEPIKTYPSVKGRWNYPRRSLNNQCGVEKIEQI